MNVFVSAIEVGSVRALLPVCIELAHTGHFVQIDKKGHFAIEVIEELASSYIDLPINEDEIEDFLQEKSIDVLLFSVNIYNARPLRIARIAKKIGIKTVHLLDYWNGYRSRMELDGEDMFQPTQYLVHDDYAKKKAIEEGVSSELIRVVGQPAFASLEKTYQSSKKHSNPFKDISKNRYKVILFASEPVTLDQGNSLVENKNYRGYTEKDVFEVLINTLKSISGKYRVMVLPHPRQNIKQLEEIWESSGGNKFGEIQNGYRSRDLLPFVNGVVGMASTFLYEAWLVGKSVLSLQPGLLNESLRMLSEKDGVMFIDKYPNAEKQVMKWLTNLTDSQKYKPQDELKRHKQASIEAIKEMIKVNTQGVIK